MAFVKDKVALITGGASGIGYAIAENLLKSGAKGILIADIAEDGGRRAASSLQDMFGEGRVVFLKTDVTNATGLEAAFRKTIEVYSFLDIVVNNAGILSEIDWEKSIRINLEAVMRGSFLAMDTYLPKYRSTNDAVILNISSVFGIGGAGSTPAYTASKHGVTGFGKSISMASAYKRSNIRVITICPNLVSTPLIDGANDINLNAVKDVEMVQHEMSQLCTKISSPEYIGKNVVEIISKGANGSFWLLENELAPYEVEFPHWSKLAKAT